MSLLKIKLLSPLPKSSLFNKEISNWILKTGIFLLRALTVIFTPYLLVQDDNTMINRPTLAAGDRLSDYADDM